MPSRFSTRLIVAVTVTVAVVAAVAATVVIRVDNGASPTGPSHRGGHHPGPPVKTRHVQPGPKHPNIVLILTDDQRWDTLWSMPNVQKLLVDHGVTFANAFVTNSFCCPSRSTILTGNYSHTTGIYGNPPRTAAPSTSTATATTSPRSRPGCTRPDTPPRSSAST